MITDLYVFNKEGEIVRIVPNREVSLADLFTTSFPEGSYISYVNTVINGRKWRNHRLEPVNSEDVPANIKASLLLII